MLILQRSKLNYITNSIMAPLYLRFKKTFACTRRCTFPDCTTPEHQLRDVKRCERFKAFHKKKIYIPYRARLCAHHVNENTWECNAEGAFYTQKQIEDLITLVSNPKLKIERSGKNCNKYFLYI